ncbi:helix-turn-helix domain-containing protein [Escherichia albertii]|nr:helix-turn-helix domain-containing protein [Escherichia albertii]
MASNYGEVFNPHFERLIQYTFDKPVATTIANKKTGKTKERFNLDLIEVTIYGKMAGFHLNGQEIFISEQTLAKICGVSDRKIIESIKTLENAGLISVIKSKGKSNHYKLLITPSQICKMCDAQGIQPMSNAGSEEKHPQEAPKQATQQAKKAKVVQLPTQDTKAPQINAVSDKPRRGRPVKDVTDGGWIVLGESEAKDRMRSLWESKYKDLNKRRPILLSKIQEDFYTAEEVSQHKGKIEGEIWKPEEYWHLTRPVFIFANKLIGMGFEILLDKTCGDYPEILWRNVRKNKKGILEFK